MAVLPAGTVLFCVSTSVVGSFPRQIMVIVVPLGAGTILNFKCEWRNGVHGHWKERLGDGRKTAAILHQLVVSISQFLCRGAEV